MLNIIMNNVQHQHLVTFKSMAPLWPLYTWGLDLIKPIRLVAQSYSYRLIAIENIFLNGQRSSTKKGHWLCCGQFHEIAHYLSFWNPIQAHQRQQNFFYQQISRSYTNLLQYRAQKIYSTLLTRECASRDHQQDNSKDPQ